MRLNAPQTPGKDRAFLETGETRRASPRLDIRAAVLLVALVLVSAASLGLFKKMRMETTLLEKENVRLAANLETVRLRLNALEKERKTARAKVAALRNRLDNLRRHVRMLRAHMKRTGFPVIVVTRIRTTKKMVALTIDDGWDKKWVARALDVLKKKKAVATLFPVGKLLKPQAALWRRAVREGHELGNHTYDHLRLPGLTQEQILSQIDNHQKALDRTLGRHYAQRFVRPPGMSGFLDHVGTAAIRSALTRRDLVVALWDNETAFRVYRTQGLNVPPAVVAKGATASVKSGSIILLHFVKPDMEALGLIIDRLKKKGFALVTMSRLMGLEF